MCACAGEAKDCKGLVLGLQGLSVKDCKGLVCLDFIVDG